ncbi:S-methyl-5'-thioadenosine phosphorylase [Actinoplanes sp. TFC3]|uniref:S-methyl-5'-thioadenosine phosphorylase n=1 Tax=Actinoplanes sp. TFC3 TaxID=1710355 RepID=UPI000834FDED|nr:S-methyl-5'-thioadenosine phosphorylase [Actinoplanes sp. TFC3]
MTSIGIIGGSGLYTLDTMIGARTVDVPTPYGAPSGPLFTGRMAGREVVFLSRHGFGHRLLPGEVPYRANIFALRELGVRRVLAISAVGSLTQRLAPGTLVVPDQIVDRTKGVRPSTFFGDGVVGHVAMAEPFCQSLRQDLVKSAMDPAGADSPSPGVVDGGTYCCIEGPQFSTRAESRLYRSWGLDIIGMTAMPEAALAREAQLCYAGLALVTDYDCWHETAETVSVGLVAETMRANLATARTVLAATIAGLEVDADCSCHHALDAAVMTDPALIPPFLRRQMAF